MFTGYSTLKMAQVLPHDGIVHTCELMKKHKQTATKWFSKAGMLDKIQIHEGPALNTLDNFQAGLFDMIFIDADKANYPNSAFREHNEMKRLAAIQYKVPKEIQDKIPKAIERIDQELKQQNLRQQNWKEVDVL